METEDLKDTYKIATNFLVTASRRASVIKWFTSKEEALGWLKEE